MAGRTDGLIKNFRASGAIAPWLIVKPGASDTQVAVAAASGDALIGVSSEIAAEDGQRCDVMMSDIADVRYGANVTRGDLLTSDANGRAITAAPAAGVKMRTIGFALISAVAGDVGPARIVPGQITG